jgi:hypothetical protein
MTHKSPLESSGDLCFVFAGTARGLLAYHQYSNRLHNLTLGSCVVWKILKPLQFRKHLLPVSVVYQEEM